jgi:protein involved in polysaccharide export with SLBB domain
MNSNHTMRLFCIAAGLACTVVGQQQTLQPAKPPEPALVERPRYVINPGDVVEFKFSYTPDMNERVTVRPDGFVSLPIIGDVTAAGSTPEELAKAVSSKYEGTLKRPHVVVIVREFSAQRVFVAGEVNLPGVLPIVGRITMTQAVLNAGGPKPTARLSQVLLLRYDGENRTSVQSIRLSDILKGAKADIPLRPYDVVYVPRTPIAKVGLFVEQYINSLVPRNLLFPYNVNTSVSLRQ